jgi:molybdopterin-guanine dinucleotide biosynthesis protein A
VSPDARFVRSGKSGAEVACFVLAGGKSSRFGENKAFARLGGVPVLELMLELLFGFTKEPVIIGSRREYEVFEVEVVEDRHPGEGPLGGIITALDVTSKSPARCAWNLIVSCDMPFVTRAWLSYMVDRALSSAVDVLFPRSQTGDEPLCGCWRTAALPQLQAAFDEGIRKVTDAAARVRVEVLDETHWKRFDTAGRLFWNMNTQQHYEEAVRIWITENE